VNELFLKFRTIQRGRKKLILNTELRKRRGLGLISKGKKSQREKEQKHPHLFTCMGRTRGVKMEASIWRARKEIFWP